MNERLDYLDSVRGLAAITVVFSHFFSAYGLFPFLDSFADTPLHIFWHGEGAVSFFYVLSGYVLSFNIINSNQFKNDFNIIHYLIKRVFRIYPLVITCTIISFFFLNYYIDSIKYITNPSETNWAIDLWKEKLSYLQTINQALLLVAIPIEQTKLLPQGWTLQAEMVCSAILPFSIILFKKQKAMFFLAFLYFYFAGNWTFFAFALGMLIANYLKLIIQKLSDLKIIYLIILAIVALFLYTTPYNLISRFFEKSSGIHFKFQCIGSSIFLILILINCNIKNLLSNKILVFFGKISFGIYLTHMFILLPFTPYLFHSLNNYGVYGEYSIRIIGLVVLLSLTFILSYVFYNIIELPFIKISKIIISSKFLNNKFVSSN